MKKYILRLSNGMKFEYLTKEYNVYLEHCFLATACKYNVLVARAFLNEHIVWEREVVDRIG